MYSKPSTSLTNIKQREGETLKSYLKQFSDEATRVHSVPKGGILFTAMGGVYPKTKLWNDLQERDCRTFEEFSANAEKYLHLRMLKRPWGKLTPPPKTPKIRRGNTRSLSRMTRNGSDLRIPLHQLYFPGIPTTLS